MLFSRRLLLAAAAVPGCRSRRGHGASPTAPSAGEAIALVQDQDQVQVQVQEAPILAGEEWLQNLQVQARGS
jgi:hypothetical protein